MGGCLSKVAPVSLSGRAEQPSVAATPDCLRERLAMLEPSLTVGLLPRSLLKRIALPQKEAESKEVLFVLLRVISWLAFLKRTGRYTKTHELS